MKPNITGPLARWTIVALWLVLLAACGEPKPATIAPGESAETSDRIDTQPGGETLPLDASDNDTATDDTGGDTTGIEQSADTLTPSTDADLSSDTSGGEGDTLDLGEPFVPKVGANHHKLIVDGMERHFIVHLSAGALKKGNAPVVFMFHGSGGDGQKFYNISHWVETADREGLIAVFPTALVYCYFEDDNKNGVFGDPGERTVGTKWANGKLANPELMPLCDESVLASLPPEKRALADHPLMDDIAFVKAMVALLQSRYPTDPKRFYATGFSNGGGMVGRLTLEMASTFAATHSHAGFLNLTAAPVERPIGYITSVGEIDDRLTTALGVTALPLQESLLTDLPWIAAKVVLPALTMLQLEEAYSYDEPLVNGKKVVRYRFTTSKVGWTNELMFLVIEGLGHQYPNGTNHPLIAADLLWQFFKQYSL